MLGIFELEDEALDVSGVDAKFLEWISDGEFIFYDRHEYWVDILMGNVEFLCWECLDGQIKDLGMYLWYIYLRLCGVGR